VVADRLRRNLFLLVKEALHNVVKHAGAGRVWLTLRVEGQILTLMLRDDGRGFDPTQTRRFGQGLKSLYRRAADSGGELVLETAPGQGTLLTVRVPVAPATGADGNRRRRWWHGAGSRLIIPAVGWRRRS